MLSTCFIGLSHLHAAAGSDDAGNYSTWSSGDNQGTGFGPWNLVQVNGGWFLGDPFSRASNLSSLVTSGKTFGLWSSDNVAFATRYAKAIRAFSTPLVTNDRFKISLGYQWDNGDRGFNLLSGTSEVFNFNINSGGMSWTGGGSYAAIPWGGKRENGVRVDITIIKTATGLRFTITSPEDSNLNGAGSVVAAEATGFEVYLSRAGGGSGADFNFNNLVLEPVPGDVTPPDMTLNGDKLVRVAVGGTYTPPDPAVTFSDDVTATANIVVTASLLDTSMPGLKTITYTARDEANNEATITRVVLVGDLTATTADTYYNLHSPATLILNPTSSGSVYGQIYLKGATPGVGQTPNTQAWIGVNSNNSDPSTWSDTAWKSAAYNPGQTGNNDEYSAQLTGADYTTGNTYYYATRWQVTSGAYAYGGTTGPWNGTTSLSGVLTVEGARTLTFAVNMNVQSTKSSFDPASQGVEVRGSFNNWTGGAATLTDADNDGIYTGSFTVAGDLGATVRYKFYRTGTTGADYEALANNRTVALGADGVNSSLATAFFYNDDGIGPLITLTGASTINLNVGDSYVELGATATDTIDGSVSVTPSGTVTTSLAGTYTVTYNASDAAGNAATPVTRMVIVAAAPSGSTFAVAYPDRTLTDVAPNGLTYLANYAFGGNATTQATLPVQDTSDPTKLRLAVVFRTDDNSLTLGGQASTGLEAAWSSAGVTVADGDSTGLPANTARKVISVDRGSDPKKFLRATVTK